MNNNEFNPQDRETKKSSNKNQIKVIAAILSLATMVGLFGAKAVSKHNSDEAAQEKSMSEASTIPDVTVSVSELEAGERPIEGGRYVVKVYEVKSGDTRSGIPYKVCSEQNISGKYAGSIEQFIIENNEYFASGETTIFEGQKIDVPVVSKGNFIKDYVSDTETTSEQ